MSEPRYCAGCSGEILEGQEWEQITPEFRVHESHACQSFFEIKTKLNETTEQVNRLVQKVEGFFLSLSRAALQRKALTAIKKRRNGNDEAPGSV